MSESFLVPVLLLIVAAALVVCWKVGLSIMREWNGDAEQEERRKEEEAIRKQIEKWRAGK